MELPTCLIVDVSPTQFFSNPIVGLVGSVASVLGVLLALHFYRKSRHFRELVYQVDPSKAALVRADQLSRLKTSFDGRVIETDITAAQITLWNRGTSSIRSSDILEPVAICLGERIRILEATVRKTTRDVLGLTLDQSEFETGKIGIYWKILENNDGCTIQIIYSGNSDVRITVEGVIEGQHQIRSDLDPTGRLRPLERVLSWLPLFSVVLGVFGLGATVALHSLFVSGLRWWRFALVYGLGLLLIVAGGLLHRPFQRPSRTPLD